MSMVEKKEELEREEREKISAEMLTKTTRNYVSQENCEHHNLWSNFLFLDIFQYSAWLAGFTRK